MPNAPKTPTRSIRIPDDVWAEARDVASANGETTTDIVNRLLVKYLRAERRKATRTVNTRRVSA